METEERTAIKEAAIRVIATGRPASQIGRAIWRVGEYILHVRFCVARNNGSFRHNLNKSTFSAHFELWIIGDERSYYLIPVEILKPLSIHPGRYLDRHHPRLTVVAGNTGKHRLAYARNGLSISIKEYWGAALP
jgi:hypothetical protein